MVATEKESKGENPDLDGALSRLLIFSQQSRYQRALSVFVVSPNQVQPRSSLLRYSVSLSLLLDLFFSSVSISTFNVNQERNTEETADGEDRSVESRWHVESLNHGVVQWLQGRRKPRVGCAGQNGPSSTGIFSPVQHAPSVVLFFVAFVASKNKIPAIDMMEGSNDIR